MGEKSAIAQTRLIALQSWYEYYIPLVVVIWDDLKRAAVNLPPVREDFVLHFVSGELMSTKHHSSFDDHWRRGKIRGAVAVVSVAVPSESSCSSAMDAGACCCQREMDPIFLAREHTHNKNGDLIGGIIKGKQRWKRQSREDSINFWPVVPLPTVVVAGLAFE